MKISVEANIDVPRRSRQVMEDDGLWTFAATEWHRLYSPYVPLQEGNLMETVVITPKQVEHTVPYAHYQYEGSLNHSTNKHPLASRRWDEAAEPTQKSKLISAMQGYIDSGRLNFGD